MKTSFDTSVIMVPMVAVAWLMRSITAMVHEMWSHQITFRFESKSSSSTVKERRVPAS